MKRTRTIGTIGYMGGLMSMPSPFVWSWSQMVQFTPEAICQEDEKIDFVRTEYSLHSAARNDLVTKLAGDWLLQLDTDMVFDPDFAARLVTIFERYKLDILTGLYTYKSQPNIPVLHMFNEATGRHESIGQWDTSSEIFGVDSAGGGCLLVRRRVFERIFRELRQTPFEMIPPYGEDHSFFMRARKLGFKAYCAWKVQAAHLGFKQVQHEFSDGLPILNEYPVTAFGTALNGEVHANTIREINHAS